MGKIGIDFNAPVKKAPVREKLSKMLRMDAVSKEAGGERT